MHTPPPPPPALEPERKALPSGSHESEAQVSMSIIHLNNTPNSNIVKSIRPHGSLPGAEGRVTESDRQVMGVQISHPADGLTHLQLLLCDFWQRHSLSPECLRTQKQDAKMGPDMVSAFPAETVFYKCVEGQTAFLWPQTVRLSDFSELLLEMIRLSVKNIHLGLGL